MNKYQKRAVKIIAIFLIVVVAFKLFDFTTGEIADNYAYADAVGNEEQWVQAYAKLLVNESLTENDYDVIFAQSGLGKLAVDALIEENRAEEIEKYHRYYLRDKDFTCVRTAIFAQHEAITDAEGNKISNPDLATLENGDIIITLSIHSLGWRHGHVAIVIDAENGETAQAVRVGEKSDFGNLYEWMDFPLVAVLRVRDIDEETQNEIADFVSENMIDIPYALSAGIIGGKNPEKIPLTTQCAHFVWYAYKVFDIELLDDGGIITPKKLLHSDMLEIVQVYGNIMEV